MLNKKDMMKWFLKKKMTTPLLPDSFLRTKAHVTTVVKKNTSNKEEYKGYSWEY